VIFSYSGISLKKVDGPKSYEIIKKQPTNQPILLQLKNTEAKSIRYSDRGKKTKNKAKSTYIPQPSLAEWQ